MNQQICELYKQKNSIIKISKIVNIPRRKVREILISENIEINKRGTCNKKYLVQEDFFDIIDTEEKAYFLGFLFADGYNNTKESFVRLTLHEQDEEILIKLNNLIQKDRPIAEYVKKISGTKYKILTIGSSKISKSLIELGCDRKKTFILEFPNEDKLPQRLRKDFIRGYFDGDGCITSSLAKGKLTPSFKFSLVSTEKFLTKIVEIFKEDLDIIINKLYIRHPERNNNIRTIYIGGNKNCKKIREWLYNDSSIFLKRKKEKFDLI